MQLTFTGPLWYWRGPAPWHFVTVPDELCGDLDDAARMVSYGWGMVPVEATIGRTDWSTSLWPKDGAYLVPVKAWVRKAEGIELGDPVSVHLTVEGA
ncbi:MAG TPA: DUF1905 domain-containing protein [Acidimicrobiales bacterium]|nr:DUF1905 domain-containing protein [Acidimicrobiales bacterium]